MPVVIPFHHNGGALTTTKMLPSEIKIKSMIYGLFRVWFCLLPIWHQKNTMALDLIHKVEVTINRLLINNFYTYMNISKNTIIGILAAVVIIVGAAYLINQNQAVSTVTPVATSTDTTTNSTSVTPTPVPAATVPSAPTVQTNSNVITSSSVAVVNGSVIPNGASTTYWYEYGETTSFGSQTDPSLIGSGYSSIAAPGYMAGLKANTLYYFRLSAKNSFATVNGPMFSFQTNNAIPIQSVAPTVIINSATAVSRTTVNLNGQVNPKGVATNYWFEYGTDTDLGSVTPLQDAGNGMSSLPVAVSISNLNPLTKYYFRLNAQNQYGTVNSQIMNFTTTGLALPTAPTVSTGAATNVSTNSFVATGHVSSNGDNTTTYWFEYSSDSLLANLIGNGTTPTALNSNVNSTRVQATISGLAQGSTYYYRLVARNNEGTVEGNIVSFRTR